MRLDKNQDTIILEKDNKKLEVHVNVNSNLDFSMRLKSSDINKKDSYCFIIDDSNTSVYYAMSKFYENLLNEYNNNSSFYKNRYKEYPIYNEKLDMFKFHSDHGKFDYYEFIRIFRKNGIYYIFFNTKNGYFKLSKNQSKYANFVKYFNELYSILEKEYISKNKFGAKTYKYGDMK